MAATSDVRTKTAPGASPPAGRSLSPATPRGRRLLATVVVGLLAGNLAAEVVRGIWNVASAGGVSDWIPFVAAARMVARGSQCLYCAGPLASAESSLLGGPVPVGLLGTISSPGGSYLPFLNPPPAALVLVPLAMLPLAIGFALFAALSVAAIVASYRVLTRRIGCPPWPTLVALLCVPGAFSFALGQWAGILTLCLVVALWLLDRHPLVAGLALSCLLVKPQYIWLVPLALVVIHRWRALAGLALGALVVAALSLFLVGSGGLADWVGLSLTAGTAQLYNSPSVPGLVGMALGPVAGYAALAVAVALLAVGAVKWRRRLRADPRLTVATFVCLSLLLSPHVLGQDFLLVAPAVALAGRTRPRLAGAAALLLSASFVGILVVGSVQVDVAFVSLAVATLTAALAGQPGGSAAAGILGPVRGGPHPERAAT